MKAQSNNPNLSRRDFLATTAASIAAAGMMGSGCMKEQKKATVAPRGRIPVGLELYSVRVDAEKDLAGTIAKVAKMGYEGVEFAGFYGHSAQDIRKILDSNGLVCCGSHTPWDDLADAKLADTIAFNKTIGNKYLICPWLKPDDTANAKQTWLTYAKRFNELAEKVRPHGMQVGYHNHAHDFAPVDGTTGWDLLASNTSKNVIMQFDTGNALSGGGDPLVYLKRYPGRATTIHIKEYSTKNPNALIGEGDIKWPELLDLCRKGGTKWYIIEEEKEAYPPLTAVEMSIKNFRKLIR